MPKDTAPDDFIEKLKEGIVSGLTAAHADGGKASDEAREARYARIKPLYAGIAPPALNDDGSLVNPDAGPPKDPVAKKKAKKKGAAKKPAKKAPKKK